MPDPVTLSHLGLLGLFLASLLAGSVLPFPSEAVLVAVLHLGEPAVAAVGVATLGNVLGALTVFGIGWAIAAGTGLGEWLKARYTDDPERLERARHRAERWGGLALLFAWLPVVGDALVLGAGLARLRPGLVLVCVTLGKAGRYAAVAWATLHTLA